MEKCTVSKTYSFLDYVSAGGTQLNCTFAIDFTGELLISFWFNMELIQFYLKTNKRIKTASNGVATSPSSLHFISPAPNLYERALQSVGNVIQDYDSDKQFPALGFGAKIPPHGNVSDEFFVNLSPNPFCFGVEGKFNSAVQFDH